MSIKDLFNNPGTPKIQKSVTSDELVETVESSDYVEAKKTEHEQFIPPIDFSEPSNFAKFGSAELYYEKAFERIHNYYPYDGTLAEKIEFENSSSYLDKYVFENLYPRTNGYVNFDGSNFIDVNGGPHTASSGMIGKPLDGTFDESMIYDEASGREGAFDFEPSEGFTVEFWMKKDSPVSSSNTETILDISNRARVPAGGGGLIYSNWGQIWVYVDDSDELSMDFFNDSVDIVEFSGAVDVSVGEGWNHYALSIKSSQQDGSTLKCYKNAELVSMRQISEYVERLTDIGAGLNATLGGFMGPTGLGGSRYDYAFTGSIDEFRFWKTERTPEQIYNSWFTQVGGGTNKHDANLDLGLYFKFNEGITGNENLDSLVLDYSGRINNGNVVGYTSAFRSTGSAITEALDQAEFKDPIIYSSHPEVVAKKAEYKTSGSLADLESTSQILSYFPGWMQEEDEQSGNQLKYLSQVIGSYFDTIWHQINFVNKVHDEHFISGSNKALPFSKKLLYDRGFVMPDLFVDATITENLLGKDDNEVYEKEINEVRNIIYHNIYNNLETIYKSKGTEKSFRNFFRSVGISQDLVKLNMYADDSTFVIRDNYQYKSLEKNFVNFNRRGHFGATLYQSSSNGDYYIAGDKDYLGSFTFETELVLPRKQAKNQVDYLAFPNLTSSVAGFHSTGSVFDFPTTDLGMSVYVLKSQYESRLTNIEDQTVRFMLTGAFGELISDEFQYQYNNNKWNLAVRMKHSSYPYVNIDGLLEDDYVVEFYGVEADGNTKRNSFSITSSAVSADHFRSDKIFYAGAERTDYSGSIIHNTDIRLGGVRYWHSYLSNEAIDQHGFDPETFGANNPQQSDLVDTYPVEIPREKTLALHWGFNALTGSDSSGEMIIPDLSSGSISPVLYGSLAQTLGQINEAKGIEFNVSDTKAIDKDFLHVARKRLADNLMSSDLTTIKSDETEQFFVDDDVSDNFYAFEKSMYGVISDEMMNMFSTAMDLNNLIGQPNQKYHHRYNMMDFLRDRFYDDVENEPDIEKFTSFYKWIDDSISIALQQLTPASARFSEKINNVIESHALERNKYVHQLPIVTTFESTEGSVKGISEMKYDWKHGHAPEYPEEEQHNVLWQRERKEKDGLRETLRQSRNNHSLQSSGLVRKEIDGSTRISDTYAVRRFAKTYDVSVVSQPTFHGGTNFSRNKNIHLFNDSVQPAGGVSQALSEPLNIITVGLGDGTGIVDETRNEDNQPRKKKLHSYANIQKRANNEYAENLKSDFVLPLNLMSGTVHTGYNKQVKEMFRSDVVVSNLHHDIVGNINDTSIQGPFTEAHVGGLQYRHIDINKFDVNKTFEIDVSTISSYPTGTIEFDIDVLETKYNEGTGSWVRLTDADGTRETFRYAPYYDFVDGEWSSIDELSYLISHKLDVEANKQTNSILEVTQSTSGSIYYNWPISTDANNYITASGFAGGLGASTVSIDRHLDHRGQRPEGWGLLFKTHPRLADDDGAFGFVGADYGTPYPYPYYAKATRYRDEHAKRPINVRNIKTLSGSQKAGNYRNEIEIFSTAPEHQKTWAKRAYDNENIDILPPYIANNLPNTTHYQSLIGRIPLDIGNVFGTFNNNRQVTDADQPPSFALNVPEMDAPEEADRTLGTMSVSGYSTTGSKSFSFWVNLDVTSPSFTDSRMVCSMGSDALYINFPNRTTMRLFTSTTAGGYSYNLTIDIDDYEGTWNHVVISWDGDQSNNAIFYINGSSTSVAGGGGGTTLNTIDRLYLFDYRNPGSTVHELQGSMQNFAIYNKVLSPTEVTAIYNSGLTLDVPLSSSDLYDFWYLGNELTNPTVGQEITNGEIIESQYGNFTHLTSSGNIYVVDGNRTPTKGLTSIINPDFYNIINSPETGDGNTSERNINTRFSAPGGIEVQTTSYLDAYSQTYAVHNAMPFRNLTVLNDSGEEGTIRVEDHLGLRRGLNTLRALHMGKFGIDPDYGEITSENYPSSGSYTKQHRNTSNRMEWSGSSDVGNSGVELITGSAYDNSYINSPIPRSEFGYSWIANATSAQHWYSENDAPSQNILGYAPRDGIVSSSVGFVEAIIFPSASSIYSS